MKDLSIETHYSMSSSNFTENPGIQEWEIRITNWEENVDPNEDDIIVEVGLVVLKVIDFDYDYTSIFMGAEYDSTDMVHFISKMFVEKDEECILKPEYQEVFDIDGINKILYVESIAILPKYQRKGIGKIVLKDIISKLGQDTFTCLVFEPVPGSVHFQKNQYREYIEIKYDVNDPEKTQHLINFSIKCGFQRVGDYFMYDCSRYNYNLDPLEFKRL